LKKHVRIWQSYKQDVAAELIRRLFFSYGSKKYWIKTQNTAANMKIKLKLVFKTEK